MTRWSVLLVALAIGSQPVEAQGLRDQIAELFIFGDGDDPLFLSGSADPNNPFNVQVHGEHFIPAASASNALSTSPSNLAFDFFSSSRRMLAARR